MIFQRVSWTRQPQGAVLVSPALKLATLLTPVSSVSGKFRELLGPAWTYNGTLTDSISVFGKSKTTTTGYLSRTNPYTSGAVTVGLLFTPSTISGAEGIWSIADTVVSGTPAYLLQRNGANLQVYWGGAYNIIVTGCFAVGRVSSLVVARSDIAGGASVNATVTVGINGAVYSATALQNIVVKTNEFFMSGYNGQADGAYGEFWSTPQDLGGRVGGISANQLRYIFEPQCRTLWTTGAAAAGGSNAPRYFHRTQAGQA